MLDKAKARRIITHLKSGTTPIDCVEYLNVGNERWYEAAAEQFDEIQADMDSLVRFINGYYGDGKTHFMGMLRSIALQKGWALSYVTAESTPFHKFDIVYSELIKNIILPPQIEIPLWLPRAESRGAHALLSALFTRFYSEAYRLQDRGGLNKERVLEALRKKAIDFSSFPQLHESFGCAIKSYVEAVIRSDYAKAHAISSWLEGTVASVEDAGLTRRIDQRISRDATRSISVLARRAGAGGVLVLLDEAERIMDQSRSVRNKSYGILRDLLDNADGQGGMQSCIIYVAATPEMFLSEKGFPEYDALRSRLANTARFALPELVDWRGVVVDLTKTILPHDVLLKLVERIIGIHRIAREWNPEEYFNNDLIAQLVGQVESGNFVVSRPRLLASCTATLLEIIEQNKDGSAADMLKSTLYAVHVSLTKKPESKTWD